MCRCKCMWIPIVPVACSEEGARRRVIVRRGKQLLRHLSSLQALVALSSGEAEYQALIRGACTSLGIQSRHHSARNQIERFREVLEIISRFEFDFRRCDFIFLNDSNFWCVQSSTTCNETVHVPVLWPVCTHTQFHFECMVSLTIHDNIYVYVYMCKRSLQKHEPFW